MAGSRFLKPCEARYAAVEGEALAIQWALEQSKYFTLGCRDLVIVTDHKPLVKLFGNRTLDEIANPRLFRLKQKTLLWRFTVVHMPGKGNYGADAMSRNPVEEVLAISNSEVFAGLSTATWESESCMTMAANFAKINAVTWERVLEETEKDVDLQALHKMIETIFPENKSDMPPNILEYWPVKDHLFVVDGVILKDNNPLLPPKMKSEILPLYMENQGVRVLIPRVLRSEVLQSLHSAHQGVSAMNERAKVSVFWPGMTKDIQQIRATCRDCNRITPSQAKTLPVEPLIPTTPFEAVVADYFHYQGYYYLVVADRLSGWTEQVRIKVGTNEAGASGLCKSLRKLFSTFGVPAEISSDGGPEFIGKETTDFFKR